MSLQPLSVMKRFISGLKQYNTRTSSGLDMAVRNSSNGRFWNYNQLYNSFFSSLSKSKNVSDFLKRYCGINLSNSDTGAISGYDAGGKTVKTASSILPTVIPFNKWKMPSGNKVTIDGATFIFPKASTLNDNQKFIVKALSSSWLKSSLMLIKQSYGLDFKNAYCKTITIQFKKLNGNFASVYAPTTNGKPDKIVISVNSNIRLKKDADGTLIGNWNGKWCTDRVICHELVHALTKSNIQYAYNLPDFLMEGLCETVHGIDDARGNYLFESLDSKNISKTKNMLKATSTKDWKPSSYGASIALLRFLAKQSLDNSYKYTNASKTSMALTSSFKGTYNMSSWKGVSQVDARTNSQVITIKGTNAANKIYVGKGTDTVYGNGGNDVIYVTAGTKHKVSGNKGADKIIVSGGTNGVLYGNESNDVIEIKSGSGYKVHNGTGNDTVIIKGGTNNTFYSDGGNDRFDIYNISKKANIVLNGSGVNQLCIHDKISDFRFKHTNGIMTMYNKDYTLSINGWDTHSNSTILFSGSAKQTFSSFTKRIK